MRFPTRLRATIAFVALVTPAVYTFSAGASESSLAEEAYQKAVHLHANLQYAEAAAQLDRAVALQPDVVRYRIERGEVNLVLDRFGLAALDFEVWIRNEPNSARAHGEAARALNFSRRFDESIDEFSKAIRLDPSNALYYYGRAAVEERIHRLWSSLDDYREATERLGNVPHELDLWYQLMYPDLSNLLFQMGYVDDAVRTFQRGKTLFPKDAGRDPYDLAHHTTEGEPLQVGKSMPAFELRVDGKTALSSKELAGRPYVLFRWSPELPMTTISSDWAAGPMDALVIQDDVSIMLDTFAILQKSDVAFLSIATKPLGNGVEGQILRKRDRPWKLFEVSPGDATWLNIDDFKGSFRVLAVDGKGTIQLALLSENAEEIRSVVKSLLPKLQ